MEANQPNSEVQGMIRIRDRTGVLPTMRLKVEERYFQILGIIDRDERHKELQILYKEIPA